MSKGTKIRGVRIDDDLWAAATAKAEKVGKDVSTVIREFLREFVK